MSWKQLECRISILTARPLQQGRMPANVPSPLPLGLLTQHRDGAGGCGLLRMIQISQITTASCLSLGVSSAPFPCEVTQVLLLPGASAPHLCPGLLFEAGGWVDVVMLGRCRDVAAGAR